MSILKYFPYNKPRDVQTEFLESLAELWDQYDVFVCVAPTASGKSPLAVTIANYVEHDGGARIICPNNMLVKQYEDEYPGIPTLYSSDREYARGGSLSWTQLEKRYKVNPIGVCTYHMQATLAKRRGGWQAQRRTLIIDEAHNLLPFLQGLHSKKIWAHKIFKDTNVLQDLDPATIDKFLWNLSPDLYEDIFGDDPKFVIDQEFDTWKGGYKYVNDYGREEVIQRGEEIELPQVVLKPVDVASYPETLWPRKSVEKVVLLSATIGEKDIERMGLNKRRVCYLHCESPIPVESRPIVKKYSANIVRSQRNEETRKLAKVIREIADKYNMSGKGFVHATYEQANVLRKELHDDPRFLFHDKYNREEVYQKFTTSGKGTVLIGSGMYEGVDMKGDIAIWQAIAKIPYPSLASPAVAHLAEQDEVWYLWETMKLVMQACGRVCRTPDDYGITYVLDEQFQNLYDRAMKAGIVPEWFSAAIVGDLHKEESNEEEHDKAISRPMSYREHRKLRNA